MVWKVSSKSIIPCCNHPETLEKKDIALSVNNDRNLGQNLYLLHGHADIINFEAKLNQVGFSTDESAIRTTTAVGQVMGALEEKHGFDFVFVDCAPSSGSLNRQEPYFRAL